MILEMRVYTCVPGRLPDLLERFESATLALWEKHGIEQYGFFTTVVGPSSNDLTYFLRWDSLAEREERWTAFTQDPDWISAKATSEADGPIVANIDSRLLAPTAFSSVR